MSTKIFSTKSLLSIECFSLVDRSIDRRTVFMSLVIPCEYSTIDRSILIECSMLDSQRRSLSIDRSDLDVGICSDTLSGAGNEAIDGVTGGGVKA